MKLLLLVLTLCVLSGVPVTCDDSSDGTQVEAPARSRGRGARSRRQREHVRMPRSHKAQAPLSSSDVFATPNGATGVTGGGQAQAEEPKQEQQVPSDGSSVGTPELKAGSDTVGGRSQSVGTPTLPPIEEVIARVTELANTSAAALLSKFGAHPAPRWRPSQDLQASLLTIFKGDKMLEGADLWHGRQHAVLLATQETWAVYERHAFGFDELTPVTLQGINKWGGLGMMILDSLDTLYMMGLRNEYERAARWVADHLVLEHTAHLSVFETTIRALGGLLSIYDLSGEELFLRRAAQLTAKLLPAFYGGVYAANWYQINSDQMGGGGSESLSEFGSLSLELWTLGDRAGIPELKILAQVPAHFINKAYPTRGLLPEVFSRFTGLLLNDFETHPYLELKMGASTDSYYEYLLKMWLMTKDEIYRSMWERAMEEAMEVLVTKSPSGLTMAGKRIGTYTKMTLEHLTCFLPGNLVLGVKTAAVDSQKSARYIQAAAAMTDSCWQMYRRTATGLAPEEFQSDTYNVSVMVASDLSNNLRPETVESLFYMWWATKDEKWREKGWEIFTAFALHSRTPQGAYARTQNVNLLPPIFDDQMPTFWTAETLKYLWLLFSVDGASLLETWVFNTEAHPFRLKPTFAETIPNPAWKPGF